MESLLRQFQSVFPVSDVQGRELLEACSGSVERAIELYLSRQAQERTDGSTSKAANKGQRREAELIDEPDAGAASAAASRVSAAAFKKRKEGSLATTAPPATAPPAASPSKRAKGGKKTTQVQDASQHSLVALFNRATGAKPAAASSAHAAAARKALPAATQQLAIHGVRVPTPPPPPSAAAASPVHTAAAASSPVPAASSSSAASAAVPTLLSMSDNVSAAASADAADPLRPCWQPGHPVPFVFLARIYSLMEHENGRIRMTNWLAYAFWQILAYTPSDLPAALFLSSDQLAPPYLNHQLGVGGATLVRLVAEMTGVSHKQLGADHQRLGDLGLIAAQYRLTQTLLFRPAPLSVAGVFNAFHAIGADGKRERKEMKLKKLFAAARESELCYLIRIAEGGLRIGAVVTTVLSALAKAFVLHQLYCEGVPKEQRHQACTWERVLKATDAVKAVKAADVPPFVMQEMPADATPAARASAIARRIPSYLSQAVSKLRRAYAELPSFHAIIPVLLQGPTVIYELHKHIKLTAGVPVKPQLGRPLTSIVQVLKLFRGLPFSVEVKYDGLRAQIHRLANGEYRIFSRHLMDQGDRWRDLEPFIEASIRDATTTTSFIIDAEIVAIEHLAPTNDGTTSNPPAAAAAATASAAGQTEPASYRILPFQQLSTRRRKGDSASSPTTGEARVEVSCMVYAFDFLSLNGDSLLLRSLPERRALMLSTFTERVGQFQFAEHVDISAASASAVSIEELLEEEEEAEAIEVKPKPKPKSKTADARAAADADGEEQEDGEASDSDVEEVDMEEGATEAEPASEQKQQMDADDDVGISMDGSKAEPLVPVDSGAAAAVPTDVVGAAPSATDLIQRFLSSTALPRGEGVMAKSCSSRSTYEPDVRTDQWAKLKKDYLGGCSVADSIDVVIIGAWHGNGRKAGWLSPFLAAVYNPDTEEYESFCKIMSGFTDSVYKRFTAEFEELRTPTPDKRYRVDPKLTPKMWFKPQVVWEIRGADLTISPVHSAAVGFIKPDRGISLRFPRFIRERLDKSIEQCTTSDQIARMYRGQATVHPAFKDR